MIKLLVNSHLGKQEIIFIEETGGYADLVRVLWDERVDGELPEITLGGMVRQGKSLVFDQARMDDHNEVITSEHSIILRDQRNSLLTASDWTQVIDAPVDQSAWATYRQALRDIPQQAGFPQTVVWPTQPE